MKKTLTTLLFILALGSAPVAEAAAAFFAGDVPVLALYVFLDPKGVSDPTKSAEKIYDALKTEVEKRGRVSGGRSVFRSRQRPGHGL
jgi:hypothetical protein